MEGEERGEIGGAVKGGGEGWRAAGVGGRAVVGGWVGVAGGVKARAGDVRLFCGLVGVVRDKSWVVGKVKEEVGVEGREWDFLLLSSC